MYKMPALFGQQIHQQSTIMLCATLLSLVLGFNSSQALGQAATETETDQSDTTGPEQNSNPAKPDLLQKIDNPEAIWLGQNEQRFISFFRPAVKPAGGGVAILANSNYPSLNDDLFILSYQMLADYGWSTVRMMLPEPQDKNTQKTQASDPDTASPEPAEGNLSANQDALSASIDARITLSVKHLLENNCQFSIILTGDNYTKQALEHAKNNSQTVRGIALWLVDSDTLNTETLKIIADAKLSIIDMVDNTHNASWVKERKRLFALAGFTDNYQLIQSPTHGIGTLHASRRIRYWLETRF